MTSLPIRIRLTAWYSAVLAAILALFGVSAYLAMRNSINRTVDEELQERMEGVRRLIERASQSDEDADLRYELREHSELRGSGTVFQVSDQQGNWIYRSPSLSGYVNPMAQQASAGPSTLRLGDEPFRVLTGAVQMGEGPHYVIQVAAPLDDFYNALHRFATQLIVSIPILLVSASAVGYWISRRALRPVDQITETARSISVHNLESRLAVPQTRDELQRLSETLNSMLERLQAAFKKIVQFTADASHELRTPVAVMRTRAELSLRKARTADEYRSALSQIHTELQATSDLVENLMVLARADHGEYGLQFGSVDVAQIGREVCDQGRALAQAKQIEFVERIPVRPIWIRGDAPAIRQLLLILIDNSVKYTPAGGRVEVVATAEDGSAVITVHDTGIGIASEDLPNIFERFYRADKARSRESGGVGLGLSIGKWIASAHAGTIEVQSALGRGSTFHIRLPLMNKERSQVGL